MYRQASLRRTGVQHELLRTCNLKHQNVIPKVDFNVDLFSPTLLAVTMSLMRNIINLNYNLNL